MNTASPWKYLNKGLVVILSVLVLATIASIVFLGITLRRLDALITVSGYSVRSALVLQDMTIDVSNAANSARDYVVTGSPQSEQDYLAAAQLTTTNLTTIQSNPNYHISASQIKNLQSLTNQRLALLKQETAARTTGDLDTANAIVADSTGSQLMAKIRDQLSAISAQNQSTIRPRQERSHAYLHQALYVAIAVSVFVLIICGLIIWYFQRSILRERALENTKSEFLSLASHQLRTPATNVKQYVGLLLDGYLGDLTDKQRDALQVAYKNNESEIRIMNDLLDVAKLDLQRIQLHKQRVNIMPLIRKIIKKYSPYTESHNQAIVLSGPKELMASVDQDYFKGIIEKLVDNAVKYSHNKTQITIKVRSDQADNCFEIIVKDQGLGIRKREISKLFMRFSRLANEFSANSEGSGLGLYWVKQIVDLHGGTIKVSSREGRGSKFSLRLPLLS